MYRRLECLLDFCLKGFAVKQAMTIGRLHHMTSAALCCWLFWVGSSFSAMASGLHIAAIDWCPQICLDSQRPGYVVELVNEVYKEQQSEVTTKHYPWSRAIKLVSNGDAQALLSPAKKEAPHLVYPEQPVGYQQMCFFVRKNNDWQYTGEASLHGQRVGIATDTSVEELNDFVKANPEIFQFQPYHERFVVQNAGKLLFDRIDSFIFTLNTTRYTLEKANLLDKVKVAGCVAKVPIYIAFTPVATADFDPQQAAGFVDAKLISLTSDGTRTVILRRYGIRD